MNYNCLLLCTKAATNFISVRVAQAVIQALTHVDLLGKCLENACDFIAGATLKCTIGAINFKCKFHNKAHLVTLGESPDKPSLSEG